MDFNLNTNNMSVRWSIKYRNFRIRNKRHTPAVNYVRVLNLNC